MTSNTVSILITAKDLATRRISALSKGFGTLETRLSRVSSMGLRVGTILSGLGAGFSAVGIAKTGASYEHVMNTVRYVARATTEDFKAMDAKAKELGENTEWSASQAAEGLLFLNRAGLGAKRSIEALPGVLDLATAGNIDLGRAADIASNVLASMRMEVSELTDVNDVFVATINTSNTDMEMLAESFKYSGSIAAAYGYSISKVAGLIGLLGNNGIQGSMAGTQLSHSFSKVQKVFDMYGVSATNADGSTKDLVDAIQLLEEHGASAQEIMDLFGERSGRAVAALMGTGAQAIREYLATLEDVKGEATRVATGMRDDLQGDYKQFLSVTESISNSIAENNNGFMRAFLQMLTESLRKGKADIVAWADNAVETVWTVFKSFLVGSGEFLDVIRPVISGIGDAISSMWDGFRALPSWVQEVGLVGALIGGLKGKVLLASISTLLNSIITSSQGFQAWMDGKITLGELATANHKELADLLKERGVIGTEQYDALEMGGKGASEAWAQGFVDGIDEKIKAAKDKLAQLSQSAEAEEEPGGGKGAPKVNSASAAAMPSGRLSAVKRAELELREFQALQATALSQLDTLLDKHLVSVEAYYTKRRDAVEQAADYEIQKVREAAAAQAAALRGQATDADDPKDAQDYLDKAVEAEAEAKTKILELEQQRIQALADIADKERDALKRAEAQRQKKEDLLKLMRGNISGDSQSAFAKELEDIDAQYQERLKLLEEYHATDEEKQLAHAEKVRAITEATAEHEKSVMRSRMEWMQSIVGGMGGLMTQLNQMGLQNSREGFAVYKAFATAEAMISTYAAAVKAYEQGMTAGGPWGGPALGATYAGIAIATGLAKVAMINTAQPQGYAFGGLIGGPDQGARADNVTIRATPGEYMMDRSTVGYYGLGIMEALRSQTIPRSLLGSFSIPSVGSRRPRLGFATGGSVGAQDGLAENRDGITIVNVTDRSQLDQYLASSAGKEIIVNTIRAEGPMIRRMARGEE